MIRKTYGIRGLLDYIMQIPVGKSLMTIHFKGGAMTAYGEVPATYSTSNPIVQEIIESSRQYKNKRIELIDVSGVSNAVVAENVKSESEPIAKEEPKDRKKVTVASKGDAIDWLKDNYPQNGYTTTKLLRSKASFEEACNECGVIFEIAE